MGINLREFCGEELRVANTWFQVEQRKIAYRLYENKTGIDFGLIGKNNTKFLKEVKAIF